MAADEHAYTECVNSAVVSVSTVTAVLMVQFIDPMQVEIKSHVPHLKVNCE